METNKYSSSIWQTANPPFYPSLGDHQSCDVCVIGAGIAGLSVAYCLLREGKRVVLLERGTIGDGETGRTSAHLASALDDGFAHLKRLHGKNGLKLAIESHVAAINEIERIAAREEIDCEFQRVNGYLFLGPEETREDLEEELKIAKEIGMNGVRSLAEIPGAGFASGPCLEFSAQAQFHPLKYLQGLAKAVQKMGGKIFTHTEAKEIEGGSPARVVTDRGFHVVCSSLVVATNVPFNDRLTLQTKMAAYRTYCIGLSVPASTAPASLIWDTSDPYHYVRRERDPADPSRDILIIGGEDHRTGQDDLGEGHYENLSRWAAERLGVSGSRKYSWSGQVLEPHDGLAFIGLNPHDDTNVFIVTGDSGHGLTHGAIAGILLTDLILGRENPWERIYSPSRISILSIDTFIREAVQSTAPYTDWIDGGDVSSMDEIAKGEGAVVREGLQKIAVFKDSFGRCHRYSAVCPHLNGIVRWNGAEKTWDCPCHGSRFDKTGNLINGPATTGLREIADSSVQQGESASA